MKAETPSDESRAPTKTAHERFLDLGKQVLAVPKTEIDAQEKAWQQSRRKERRKKR